MEQNIFQSFFILIVAVGVIAGIMVLIKKLSMKRMEGRAALNLNVISKITLQPKNHLFVVKAADKLLVLGVTENNINILTELDPSFERTVISKSKQEITSELLNRISNSGTTSTSNDLNKDLSFLNFVKSSFKFGG